MRTAWTVLLTVALGACRADRVAPARAEFLLLAGDSTFWVRSGERGVRVRGSAIQLARYGGRFVELYVADDDHSYEDALIVGERVFRRDLVTGDSLLVFEDSVIDEIAERFARQNPDARPLEPQEDVNDEPSFAATSEVEIVDHHGPFLSYEYHLETAVGGGDHAWQRARRGVLDLRTGRAVGVRQLFGDTAARRILRRARALYAETLDSVLSSGAAGAERAASALGEFEFDSASYALADVDGSPAVEYAAAGQGPRAAGMLLPLPPIPAPIAPWWRDVGDALPTSRDSLGATEWARRGYRVISRRAADGQSERLGIIDAARREWLLARVPTPVWRIYWLDSGVDSVELRALARAFDEAALYSEETRTAARRGRLDGVTLASVAAGRRAEARRVPRLRSRELRAQPRRPTTTLPTLQ